jgi:hypothetical protein
MPRIKGEGDLRQKNRADSGRRLDVEGPANVNLGAGTRWPRMTQQATCPHSEAAMIFAFGVSNRYHVRVLRPRSVVICLSA